MKRLFAIAAIIALCSFTAVQFTQYEGVAKVYQVEGFDIYMYSEPVAPFEQVFAIDGFWNWGEVLQDRATIDNVVGTMVKNASKKNKKAFQSGEPKADAIIILNNDQAIGIRYVEN